MTAEDSLATVLLVSRLASEHVQPLRAAEFWDLCDRASAVGDLLGQSEDELVRIGLQRDLATRVMALFDRAAAVAGELAALDEAGISTVTPFDDGYPSRLTQFLGPKAPPVIHAAGAIGLLQTAGLGVVGSRDVSPEGAAVAQAAATRASRLGLPLVSGGARGVDRLAMNAAYDAEGSVVGVLADSLARTVRSPDVRRAIDGGATVLCTPYGPDAPFSAGNAMGRNKLVYAGSLLTLVVASDEGRGGTWAGAIEALKGGFGKVAVWRGPAEGPGNAAIERRGGTAVESIDELEALLEESGDPVPPLKAEQPSLFGTAT